MLRRNIDILLMSFLASIALVFYDQRAITRPLTSCVSCALKGMQLLQRLQVRCATKNTNSIEKKKNYICSFDRITGTGFNGNRIRQLGGTQFNFNSLHLGVFISNSLYFVLVNSYDFCPFFRTINETEGTFQLMLIKA